MKKLILLIALISYGCSPTCPCRVIGINYYDDYILITIKNGKEYTHLYTTDSTHYIGEIIK